MYKVMYNGKIGEVVAEYQQDGIDYITILFDDVEINFIKKELIKII